MPKVVKSAGREIILKVKEFCEAEHKNHGVLIPINNVRKSVSEKTVTRVTKEGATAASTSKVIVTHVREESPAYQKVRLGWI
ncbi:hypothetical protein K1T71_008731 [Dendrolimus kikuchii]|uniref:Uncharacterized protein n=1 Tax=Dendrolimus kikuchii TaxID=765133 RepID=A0ACC1CWC4_9NEOP|nr:hypothetical protein K1T71_008731 [Dendrolimus kikuchii]